MLIALVWLAMVASGSLSAIIGIELTQDNTKAKLWHKVAAWLFWGVSTAFFLINLGILYSCNLDKLGSCILTGMNCPVC